MNAKENGKIVEQHSYYIDSFNYLQIKNNYLVLLHVQLKFKLSRIFCLYLNNLENITIVSQVNLHIQYLSL